jgi:hypothetical protein
MQKDLAADAECAAVVQVDGKVVRKIVRQMVRKVVRKVVRKIVRKMDRQINHDLRKINLPTIKAACAVHAVARAACRALSSIRCTD